jgi:glycosyltransferase involved in cell wall biosynthesis
MLPISACLIVKDEELVLEKCLNSINNKVKEIILVDTGSIDSTKEIARKFNAKIYQYNWTNDFSKARNFSLKYASQPWILWIDADEELVELNSCSLEKAINTKNVNAYRFQVKNLLGSISNTQDIVFNRSIRLFKNNQNIFFSGKIHETLDGSLNNPGQIRDHHSIQIVHYGYLKEIKESKNKTARNIKLLSQILLKEPMNGFHNFNMGMEYFTCGDFKKALTFFERSINHTSPNQLYFPRLIRNFVVSMIELNYLTESLKACEKFLSVLPDYADLWYLKALIYNRLNYFDQAVISLKKAITLGDSVKYEGNEGLGSYKALYFLGEVYLKIGETDLAARSFEKGIKRYPHLINFYSELIKIYFQQNDLKNAYKVLGYGVKKHKELEPIYLKVRKMIKNA